MEIKQTNITGDPKNVCTAYEPHTVSLVKSPALGVNIVKAKNQEDDNNNKRMRVLTDKINKAKAKDAKDVTEDTIKEESVVAAVDESVKQKAVEAIEKTKSEEEVEEPSEDDKVEEGASEEEQTTEDDTIEQTEEPEVEEPVEKAKASTKQTDEEEEEKEDDKTYRKKAFKSEDLGDATKLALDAMGSTWRDIMSQYPEADHYEVYTLLYDALWSVDDAIYYETQDELNRIFEEVYAEVSSRVSVAKSLKVEEAEGPVDAMKAFVALNPEAGKILKAKMKDAEDAINLAEEQRDQVIRAKALDQGSQVFKRIATDEVTTDDIVDAMSTIKTEAPEASVIIAKALETASNIINAGTLFTDQGSAEDLIQQSEPEYVNSKAKALMDESGQTNLAAARSKVRQTQEYKQMFC